LETESLLSTGTLALVSTLGALSSMSDKVRKNTILKHNQVGKPQTGTNMI